MTAAQRTPLISPVAMFDVSTDCLTESDTSLLDRAAYRELDTDFASPMRVTSHRYGYTIYVSPGALEAPEHIAPWINDGLSPTLFAILLEAVANNCLIVNFDADAESVDAMALVIAHSARIVELTAEVSA